MSDSPGSFDSGEMLGDYDRIIVPMRRSAARLNRTGNIVLMLSLANLVVLALSAVAVALSLPKSSYSSFRDVQLITASTAIVSIALTMLIVFFLAQHERQLRYGSSIYEEVSDSFQELFADRGGRARAPLDIRLAMREFADSRNLPLFPRSSNFFYLNLGIILLSFALLLVVATLG